ncbi:fatty-acid amide hydrolase 1-like [Branchiostoma floridae]|uniref:Fatty-acid amide hydrolase 1 n=1 Tax=Branchiostoma floridae TaxID=7739 RepID=A0A9J7N4C4_BRAFL|nr:fatty-acid amide hydrolase 1-like [Branchiostoma floridae]
MCSIISTQPAAQAARRRKIQSLTLTQLTQQLGDGQLSAVQVLQAFQEKATAVNEELNCLTEPIPDALVRAQNLDVVDQPLGILHGVPVSVKENYNIKGMVTTMGVTKYLGTPAGEDAVIVQVLRKQGAVPFVKTNVPQGLVNFSCSNPVFGTTVNPLDPTRSPGGSSGGEAALIRAGGSVLGFGTDGAGSVRGPAHFCGICGFKPTALRISGRGLSKTYPGLPGVISSPGLLARDVDSLALGLKALLVPDMFQLDPRVVPIPFQQETYEDNQPMRIGYFTTLPCCPPTPSMGRAVIMAKEALEKAGHTLVAFDPPDDSRALIDLTTRLMTADNGETVSKKWLKDEVIHEYLEKQVPLLKMPHFLRKIQGFLLKPFWPRVAKMISHRLIGSIFDLWQRLEEREKYKEQFQNELKKKDIDVLLCPAFGMPACKPEHAGMAVGALAYCSIFNLLDFPAGVVPVTMVTEEDDRLLDDWHGYGNDLMDKIIKETTRGAVGLPVAVQCVALPWQEEKCLRLMKEVETLCPV